MWLVIGKPHDTQEMWKGTKKVVDQQKYVYFAGRNTNLSKDRPRTKSKQPSLYHTSKTATTTTRSRRRNKTVLADDCVTRQK